MQDPPAPRRSDEPPQAGPAEGIHPVRRPEAETELVAEDEIADRWADVLIPLRTTHMEMLDTTVIAHS
ncbi:MAG: hypothetical protein R3C18_22280 [Planctomycetaceae bacterium]